mmetsp:Transcript_34746/g.90104  ORF Transcript_34746/g.90104 Transcript_34746/m.90104 type:complete len:218 (+) Transcript_34746:974-1627(+)
MLPHSTSSVCMPHLISHCGHLSGFHFSFMISSASTCLRQAMHAFNSWSYVGMDSIAFQNAMMASPMNSPTTPSDDLISSVITLKYTDSQLTRSFGVSFSAYVVKPAISEKKMVTRRWRTANRTSSFRRKIVRTTSIGTYRAKERRATFSLRKALWISCISRIHERVTSRENTSSATRVMSFWRRRSGRVTTTIEKKAITVSMIATISTMPTVILFEM